MFGQRMLFFLLLLVHVTGKYEGIESKPFSQLKDDKRMKITVFHWAGEKGGDEHIQVMQTLRDDPKHSDFVWFHVDVSTDPGAKSFKVKSASRATSPLMPALSLH